MPSTFFRRVLPVAVPFVLLVVLAFTLGSCGSSTGNDSTSSSEATTSTAPVTTVSPPTAPTTTVTPTTSAKVQPLLVSAAAGLKSAFTEIGKAFDQQNNAQTTFNFAAAGTLQKQIEGGAPVDVFASADPSFVDALLKKNLLDPSTVKTLASNKIVLIVPADSDLGIVSFEDLTNDDVKRVATGDPEITPLGKATLQILPKLNMEDSVKPKLIYTQTVTQTLDYVNRGEVDAGLVWTSEAKAAGDKIKTVATADPNWYGQVAFLAAVVSSSKTKTLAQAFIDFVAGAAGQAILQKQGFTPPPAS